MLNFDITTGLNTSNAEALKLDTQARIANLLSIPRPTSGNVILPNSYVRSGDPMELADLNTRGKAAVEAWLNKTRQIDSGFLSGAGNNTYVPYEGTQRYLDEAYGYNPLRDNEDFYARQQSATGELFRSVPRFVGLTVSKLGTGIGYLAGLADPNNWGDNYIANAADNAIARTFEGLEDGIKDDWLPSFQESADVNKGFFNRAFTDANFWTSDVVDGAAFLASAFVPGLVLSKIGAGTKAATLLSRLGIASENGVLGNLGLTKLGAYMKNAQALATDIDKTLITAVNTASEAMWEAKGVRDSVIDSLSGKINPNTGREYTDTEKRLIAGEAARNTFLTNAALLSISNLWETNLLYKALGKDKSVTNIAQRALGEAYEVAGTSTRLGRLLESRVGNSLVDITKGVAVEGFYEENAQLAAQRIYDRSGKYESFLSQLVGQTRDALLGNDTEAATNIGIGGLIGGIAGGMGSFADRLTQSRRTNELITQLNRAEGAWLSAGNVYKTNPDGTLVLDKNNQPEVDANKMAAFMSSWQNMADLKNLMDNTDDENIKDIIQKELTAKWVKAHINAGKQNEVLSKLHSIGTLPESTLVGMGFDPSSSANSIQKIADLGEYASQLIELNNTINNDILSKREKLATYELRKNYLYELGARQLALQQQSRGLERQIDNLKGKISTSTITNPSDELVDRLNYITDRINAQRQMLNAVSSYDLDGSTIDTDEENRELRDLEVQLASTIKDNIETEKQLRKKDGRYQYLNPETNRAILNNTYQKKLKQKAELDNTARSVNNEFYKVADIDTGAAYYESKLTKQLDTLPTDEDNEQPEIDADQAAKQDKPTGKTITIKMASNTDGTPVDVELEEGRIYVGPLSSSPGATKKGVKGTVYRNDNIRVVRINDDGTIGLSINGEPVVDFTQEELSSIPAFVKYLDLSPLQRLYLHNRNKLIRYRIPVKFNKNTKKWETVVVNGRLSYDKKNHVLNLVYKTKDGKSHTIEFNSKYMIGSFELTELPNDIKQALGDQEARLNQLKSIQSRLFESLITNTDEEIDLQKRRTEENQARLTNLQSRLEQLNDRLERAQTEFSDADKSRITDKRTKAARLDNLIKNVQDEITEIETLISSLEEERKDIQKRQAYLEFMLDEYLTAYDRILDTDEPITRGELTQLEQQQQELREIEGNTSRLTTAQIEGLLEDTVREIELVEEGIKTLEPYVAALRVTLNNLFEERKILDMYLDSKDLDDLKNRIRTAIGTTADPSERAFLQKTLSRASKDPQLFFDTKKIASDLEDNAGRLRFFSNRLKALKPKEARLTEALNIRSQLNDTTARINYLKDVFAGLANQLNREKASKFVQQSGKKVVAKTAEDAKRLKEEEQLLSDFLTEPPTPEDQEREEQWLFADSMKPVLTKDNNPLFKSADSHFPEDKLNPQAYTQRFFKFTSTIQLDGSYYILPITETNDGQFGANIRFTDNTYKDDIKFVVVRKIGNEYKPVGLDGRPLDSPTIDNIVYSSFYGHPDLLSLDKPRTVKWMRDNFAVKSVSDDELFNKAKEFVSFRERVKNTVKSKGNIYLPISSKSNGVQNREPKDISTGLPQQLAVEGRIVPNSPNWDEVDLRISTTGNIPGSTVTNIKNGRLAILRNGNVFQVYNRRLNQAEKDKIKRLLLRLVDSFSARARYDKYIAGGVKLKPQEEQQFRLDIDTGNRITQYLSTILYWRGPLEDKPAQNKQFYVKRGFLYKGIDSIPFTKEAIESELDNMLSDVYHQVSNVLLSAEHVNRPYRELDIDTNNEITYKTWNSYKEYLLSSRGRQPSEIPVYTNVVPLSNDPTVPQLKNVYLRFTDLPDSLQVIQEGKLRTNEIPFTANISSQLRNGKYTAEYENSKSGSKIEIHFTMANGELLPDVDARAVKGDIQERTLQGTTEAVLSMIIQSNEYAFAHPQDPDVTITGYERYQLYKAAGVNITITSQSVSEPTAKTAPVVTPPAPTVTPEEPKPEVPKTQDLLKKFKGFSSPSADDENVRVVLANEDYIKENIPLIKSWFSKNLPQVPVEFTDYLIKGRYWGQFKNGAVYIYNEAELGTGFHEAFEAVWNSLLSPTDQQSLINEFKRRDNYKKLLAKTAVAWKGLNEDQLIKETLAEEFRTYVLNDGDSIIKGQGKRNSFFRRLWNFIKSLFGISPKEQSTIDNLFRKINTGGFRSSPVVNYEKAVAHFRSIPGLTQEMTTQAIEGIASQFFIKLTQRQLNPESLFSKKNNAQLIRNILAEIEQQVTKMWTIEGMTLASIELGYLTFLPSSIEEAETWLNNNITAEQFTNIDSKLNEYASTDTDINFREKMIIINNFNRSVKSILYDYLRQFGFVIHDGSVEDEQDPDITTVVEERETLANDPLGIRDSITIDTRNTANTTVRLLIASLTDDQRAGNTYLHRKNTLGLPIPIDYDKASNLLFNELQGITSTITNEGKHDVIDTMFKRLDNKFKDPDGVYRRGFEWIDRLKRRLKYVDRNGQPIPHTDLSDDDIRLRVAFIKSYSKARNNPIKLIMGDNNYIYDTNPVTTSNAQRVRESWENNAKANFQRSNDFLQIKDNRITFNTSSDRFKSLMDSTSNLDRVELLRQLGITFSIPDIELTTKHATSFSDAAGRIIFKIKDGTITTFDDLFSKQVVNGPINTLLSIEIENTADNLSLQYRNPEGQTEYVIVNPSLIANITNSLRSVSNLRDLILSNPQFGTVEDDTPSLHRYQQGSELLTRILFDENGNKKRDLTYQLISGVAQMTEADGDITSRLKRPDKIVQEIYHLLNGTYYTIINSDKSSEFGLNFGHFVPMYDFVAVGRSYTPEVRRIYTNHLRDEVNSLIDLKNGVGSNIQYFSNNQRDKKTKQYLLTHFRDIITSERSKNLLQRAVNEENPELFVADPTVQQEIENYLNDFIKRQQDGLVAAGIIQRTIDGRYRTKALSEEQLNKLSTSESFTLNPNDFSQPEFDNLARYLFINHQISVREQHKLIYGHPALYKDLPKRSNGATSTKEAIVDDTSTLLWMDQNYKRYDNKVRSNDVVQTFNNVSYRDVNVVSLFYKDMAEGMYSSMIQTQRKDVVEKRIGATFDNNGKLVSLILKDGQPTGDIAAYINDNEADAQAYILPDFYRDLLFLSGKWSSLQNDQWNYEIAYERLQRSKRPTDDPSHRPYTPEEKAQGLPKKDQELVDQGTPGAVFPVLKPQYFGYQVSNTMMHTTFLKHSVQPRFWRFFEGTNFEHIYVNALNNQIDIIGYESGEKVGNVYNDQREFTSFYDDNGKIQSSLPPIQKLFTKFYGIQVEMAAKLKDKVVRGTQMTKIIMSNIFKQGIPAKPEYQSVIDEYNEILRQMTRLGKKELLHELGLEQTDGTYVTRDLKKLVSTLRDEAVKRDLPSNIIEAFEASLGDNTTGLVYKFDSFSNRDKIDNILNAIVDSRVISHKMHGKAAVQAAVTLTEAIDKGRGLMFLNADGVYEEVTEENESQLTPEQRESLRLTSSDLKFYKLQNGKVTAMEVYLPHWFEELYGKDQSLNISKLDPRLIRLIGFRIPTQGMNSIDNIIVKGFLKPEEGDTVIVPSELTGKSGSDFDIDKLNIYIPNYKIINNVPTYIEYKGDPNTATKEELENRLIELMSTMLSFPENYRQLIVPNGASTLKNLESAIFRLKGRTKDKVIPFTQLSEWDFMNETRERFLVGKMLVGIGAVHITNHALSQISNIILAINPDLGLRFRYNVNSDDNIYISGVTDIEGQWISELLSEFLTGFVDAAKDPFVFELNINPSTAGSYFYLLRLGVPVDDLVYFHTQPIISKYLSVQQVNESLLNKVNGDELRKDYVRAIAMSEFVTRAFPELVKDSSGNISDLKSLAYAAAADKGEYDMFNLTGWGGGGRRFHERDAFVTSLKDVDEAIESYGTVINMYSKNSLTSAISDYYHNRPFNQEQAKLQLLILSDFLNYQDQGSSLSAYVNAVSYDTARTKNIVENVLQGIKYNNMISEGFIDNPEEIMRKTFLNVMKQEKEEIPKMFANYFVFLHNNATQSFNRIYDFINSEGLQNLTDSTKKEILNRYQNFFLNYIIHNVRFNNPLTNKEEQINSYYRLLFGNDSFAKQVGKYQRKYPNNKLLKELFPLVSSDRTGTDNVKLFVTKMSSYEANTIIESAVNLLEIANEDPETKTFMNDLAAFALVQSGVQQSPISYTKVLPNELYAQIVGVIFDRFTDSPSNLIDPDILFSQFFQNYFFNRTIVPLAKDAKVDSNGILTIPNSYNISNYPFVARREERKNPATNTYYTMAEKEQLIRNKQWDLLYNTNLYREFFSDDKRTYYRPVNKLGNKQFAIEAYTTDTYYMTKQQIALSDVNGYINEQSYKPHIDRIAGQLPEPPKGISSGSLVFEENPVSGYRDRTLKNASADVTIALAVDFNSAGEILTRNSVTGQGKLYIPLEIDKITNENIDRVTTQIANQIDNLSRDSITLNIAGNGIYTLRGKYSQQQVDDLTFDILSRVIQKLKTNVSLIRSGGQTGFDEAGIKASIRLGIPSYILAPKGWTFRDISGKDISDEKLFKDRFSSGTNDEVNDAKNNLDNC